MPSAVNAGAALGNFNSRVRSLKMSWKSISRRIKKAARGERAVKAKENTTKRNGSESASTDEVKAKKNSGTLPAKLKAELTKVREAAPPPPTEDPIYKYLTRVYRLRCKVEKSPDLQEAIKAKHAAHHPRTSKNYAGVIIQLTGPDITSKNKHKYVTALEYAFRDGIKVEALVEFIHEHGGLNEVAELWKKKYGRSAVKKQSKRKAA